MGNIEPFEKFSKEYDKWFVQNKDIFLSELNIIKSLIPKDKEGIEIGTGSGRFAKSLEIKIGIDPSTKMNEIATKRGLTVYKAVAEELPFNNKKFDFVLMITTICFVDDILKSFQEAYRILKYNGCIIVGFIDKNSDLGKKYQFEIKNSKFYRYATFYSKKEVINFLKKADFKHFIIKEIFFSNKTYRSKDLEKRYHKGNFIVIKAVKSNNIRS